MPNAHREQLYDSTKVATQPSRLRSADGVFWSHMTRRYYRFALVPARPRQKEKKKVQVATRVHVAAAACSRGMLIIADML